MKKLHTIAPYGYNIGFKGGHKYLDKRPKSKYEKLCPMGKRFGSWVVDGGVSKDPKGRAQVSVKCDCGTWQHVYCHQLVNKKTTQCKKCSSGQSPTTASYSNKIYRGVIGSRQDCSVSPETITQTYALQDETCALTGQVVPLHSAVAVQWNEALGYEPGNTIITSTAMQKTMAGMDGQTFVNMCSEVIQHNPVNKVTSIQEFFDKREKDNE